MLKNIDIEKAYSLFDEKIKNIDIYEEIDIVKGLGRVLGENIYSPINQPNFSKSAMDGFAFNSKDLLDNNIFTVQGVIYAGDNFLYPIEVGKCCKIMTGAKIPNNCDIVIKKEQCRYIDENTIEVMEYNPKMTNICYEGEEYGQGALLLEKDEKLDYVALGILSSVGIKKIKVRKRLKIALFITGDEVCPYNSQVVEGKIFDANGMLLSQRLKELGYNIEVMEYFGDDIEKIRERIIEVSNKVDMILTTGGVSVGDKDIFHQVLEDERIERVFWRVNFKPGTPVMFSMIGDVPILSLSGNPFASLVSFEMLGRKLLSLLAGDTRVEVKKLVAIIEEDYPKSSDKVRFVRGIYENGNVRIPKGLGTSSAFRSFQKCNCLIEIPKDTEIKGKSEVRIWLI